MKRKSIVTCICALILAVGCGKQKNSKVVQKSSSTPSPTFVTGKVVVKTNDSALVSELKTTYSKVKIMGPDQNIFVLEDESLAGREREVSGEFSEDGRVIWAEPVFKRSFNKEVIEELRKPKDPQWYYSWGLKNYGQDSIRGIEGKAGADVSALAAWKISKGSNDFTVAVIDTGIDRDHPDLAANIFYNDAEVNGSDMVDDDGNGWTDDKSGWNFITEKRDKFYDPTNKKWGHPEFTDDNGHGTHCAGIIGAMGNTSEGTTGVNWNVKLLPLKVLNSSGSGTTEDIYEAYRYVAANAQKFNIVAVNASYGGGEKSKFAKEGIEAVAKAGVVFVAAAGNDGANNDQTKSYPASYKVDGLISVAATNNRDGLARFSNYGFESVDLAAPGVSILSTIPGDYTQGQPGKFAAWSGTSMATPFVAGAVALTLSANSGLRGDPKKIKQRLMATSDKLPHLTSKVKSGGRLNLYRAVNPKVEVGENGNAYEWEEVKDFKPVRSPRGPVGRVVFEQKIQVKGAKYIRAHVKRSKISSFDSARVYDGQYRFVTNFNQTDSDYYLPPVSGDTMWVQFSNAVIQLFSNDPVPNIDSEGFEIDKVEFVAGKEE